MIMRPLTLLLTLLATCHAFQVSWTPTSRSTTCLNARQNDGYEEEDIEQARSRLEKMMGHHHDERSDNGAVLQHRPARPLFADDTSPPPLTAISKERRLAEIQLLAQLKEGDDVLDDLWTLWFSERGPQASRELQLVEELTMQGPRAWPEAEERLLKLIHEYGIYFCEPVNRLATLLFLQGRLEESREMCERVLEIKPWHFGALSGIVMVCAGLKDPTSARTWAPRRLPPMQPTGENKRRSQWVERAVSDATKALLDAERRVQRDFGEPDDWNTLLSNQQQMNHDDEDAWQ